MKTSKKMSVDEAVLRRGDLSKTPEAFIDEIKKLQDERFTDLRSLVFGWVPQPDGSKKLMSKLPNGKVVFVDRKEKVEVKPGRPYICLVYEREREAFAKVLCEEEMPVVWVLPNKLVTFRYRKGNKFHVIMTKGQTYPERMMEALKRLESEGFPEVKIIFRENERRLAHNVV